MKWEYHDGGRATAGYRGRTRDCVTRAVAIATQQKYFTVYCAMSHINEGTGRGFTARDGIVTRSDTFKEYMEKLGWEYETGYVVPEKGTYLVKQMRHMFAVIDGVAYDLANMTHRPIEGYWRKKDGIDT